MSIADVTPAGRVKNVTIRSARGITTVPAETLRASLGNTEIPSVFFELELSEGEAVFSGRGRGHGVGLCQWGAKEMAEKGQDFRSILSHYYPGAVLERMN
jgi:stage II sporulation protein D